MREFSLPIAVTLAAGLAVAACASTPDGGAGTRRLASTADGRVQGRQLTAPSRPAGVPVYERTALSAAEYLGVDEPTAYVKDSLRKRAQRVRIAFGALPTPAPGEDTPPFVSCPLRVVVIDRRCDVLVTRGIDDEVICRAAPEERAKEAYTEADDVVDDRIVWVAAGGAPDGQGFRIIGPEKDPELEVPCEGGVEAPRDAVRRCRLRPGGQERPPGTLSTYAYRIAAEAYWYGTDKPAEGQSCPELDPHFVVRN